MGELLCGRPPDRTDDLRNAASHLARYPSERALVELLGRELDFSNAQAPFDPVNDMAVSAATVVGTVLHNPRLASCTRIVGSDYLVP